MKEDMLLVDYDPFACDSRILIMQNGVRSSIDACSDIPELSKALISYAQQYNLYNMKIHAPVNFFYELKRITEKEELNQYSENKITMEIC